MDTPEASFAPDFLIESSATLVCLGDSLTEAADGYVTVMRHLITAAYPERAIRIVNAGISGNHSKHMLARLDRDVIAHRPDWVTINAGINDVWHGFRGWTPEGGQEAGEHPQGDGPYGTSLEEYERALTTIVERLRAGTDAQIVLLTPTVIGEDVDNPDNIANRRLKDYVEAMQRVALAHGTMLSRTHADFVRAIRAGQAADPAFRLTTDGVHMTPLGSHVMALTVLKTLQFAGME